MASDKKFLACALAALPCLLAACVSTDKKSAPPIDPKVTEIATDIAAAARAQGLGGRAGLERWVAQEPARALAVARGGVALDVVATTRSVYAQQSGLDDERFARAE